jgi:hypothetical protein
MDADIEFAMTINVFRNSNSLRFEGAGREACQSPDRDYLRRREQAERAAAKRAACPLARRVHQDLAQAYAGLARAAVTGS